MWRVLLMLVAGVMAVAGYGFDPSDESDYIDNPDDSDHGPAVVRSPARPADYASEKGSHKKLLKGQIDKLLGQTLFNYEQAKPSRASLMRSGEPDIYSRVSDVQKPGLVEVHTNPKSITGSMFKVEEAQVSTKGRSSPTLRIKSIRTRTSSDEVYSIRVANLDAPGVRVKGRPGVIERIVKAHDVTRFENTRLRRGEAFNQGGVRQLYDNTRPDNDTGRRYLVEIPKVLKQHSTRPPRPTPTTIKLLTTYGYTRRTRRHPNCTDSYYECLFLCFNRKGYRLRCPWDTTTRPEPARMNMSALLWAINSPLAYYDTDILLNKFKNWLFEKQYRTCRSYTTRSTTLKKLEPVYYDDVLSKQTGTIMAKCWVCGLLDHGIPKNSNCADNFGNLGTGANIAERSSYMRYCRYMDEVPLWYNRSDPFSVWGHWTGGCAARWMDLSGLYTQRTCRSIIHPAVGHHYLSRRMARLELALRNVTDGCIVSPTATLIPFSRAVSLYGRFHACVCTGTFCNRAPRRASVSAVLLLILLRASRVG